MQTIFITLPETFIARNIFFTDFWKTFRDGYKGKIILLVKPEKLETYQALFQSPNTEVVAVSYKPLGYFRRLIDWMALNGIDTHTNTWEKMFARTRSNAGFISTTLKIIYTKIFGNIPLWKKFIRYLYLLQPSPKELDVLFDTYKPAHVFATSLTNREFDVWIAVVAKKRKIPLIGMPRSWDNFTSHGLIRMVPDELIIQNQYLSDMAFAVQKFGLPQEHVHIVGLPHYDIYKNYQSLIVPRDTFLQKLGIDQNKKIITYGAMGDFLFPHEGAVAPVLNTLIQEKKIPDNIQFLFRAHPRFLSPLEAIKSLPHVTPDTVALHVGKDQAGKEIDIHETAHLINTIFHSDIIITGASTFAIDAIALGKPVICIDYDLNLSNITYWQSAKRFYDTYTHFEALVETGAVRVVKNDEDLASAINQYVANPLLDQEGRNAGLQLMVDPFDGKAGLRLGNLLVSLI